VGVNSFDEEMHRRLADIRDQGLYRELRRIDSPQGVRIEINGKHLLNFSSNDYLGLANHPALKEAAIRAVHQHGAGCGASRLISGSLSPLHQLEDELAAFKATEAALSFSTGYATAIGSICALMGRDDVIILDKLVHASIVDAARLSGAKIRVFAHNDLDDLEDKLKWARQNYGTGQARPSSNILVVTESIFSMDGDQSPLSEIVRLKEQYGAWLMVDEAHATGVYGKNGRGLAEQLGVASQIEIQMGTLGKAAGASGGYICGPRSLIDLLINRARSFIFSTAPVPAAAAAATAGIQLIRSEEGETLRQKLRERIKQSQTVISILQRALKHEPRSGPVIPLIIGNEAAAMSASSALRERGILIPAIRYPSVARGSARLRITLTATHSNEDLQILGRALNAVCNTQGAIHAPANSP
jgi:8-amino-7-oxononanoate synthase